MCQVQHQLQRIRLLIADSPEIMLSARFAIQEHGQGNYRLEWAPRMSDGLVRIRDGGVDIILLDLGTKESSGLERFVWARVVAPLIPIVTVTNDPDDFTEEAIRALGADDYLEKDRLSGSQLCECLHSVLARKKKTESKVLKEHLCCVSARNRGWILDRAKL